MNEQNLKLQSQIEQLEKRVSNIKTADVSNILKTIQTSKQDIQSLNNSFADLSSNLNIVSENLDQLSSNISYNDLLTLNLARNTSDDFNTSSQTETFYTTLQELYADPVYLVPWSFVVGLGQVVSGRITVHGLNCASTTVWATLLINDKINCWTMASANEYEAITFVFDFSFVPTQKNNKFSFVFEDASEFNFYDIKIEFFTGNNPIVLNYTNQNQICMFENSLIVLKGLRTATKSFFLEKTTDITLQDQEDIQFETSSFTNSLSNEKMAMLNDSDWIMYGKSLLDKNSIYISINGANTAYNNSFNESYGLTIASSPTPFVCSDVTNTTTKYKYIILAINNVQDKGPVLYATKGKMADAIVLKYNNQELPNVFIDVQAVLPMGEAELGDGTTFYGYVAVREDGECIYFPAFDSTYYIKLGFGRNPFCFIKDQKITITLGGKNFCRRIELAKNSDDVWAIEEQYCYRGIDHLYPLNNQYLVYIRKSDNLMFDDRAKYFFKKDIQSIQYVDVDNV